MSLPEPMIHVLGIAGSLRAGSYNRALLSAARALAPAGMEIDPYDLRGIPLYDSDVEALGDPPAVAAFKNAIHAADALLLATPEYNGGISGVLKNAIDWASRPWPDSVLNEKVVAIMGATQGRGGTASAQEQLRALLARVNADTVPGPALLVAAAHLRVESGVLRDPALRAEMTALLSALRARIIAPRDGAGPCSRGLRALSHRSQRDRGGVLIPAIRHRVRREAAGAAAASIRWVPAVPVRSCIGA